MELQAGMPAKKGNKRGPAYAYNVKELRERETEVARQAERAYEHFVSQWQTPRPPARRTGAAKAGEFQRAKAAASGRRTGALT